jgi:hypothetical protein
MIQGRIRTSQEMEEGHDSKIRDVLVEGVPRESRVVIIDADSLLYIAGYTGKDEEGNKKPEYTPEEYPIAEGLLKECILNILNNIEEHYDIERVYICVKGENNFRYTLHPEYKAGRPPSPLVVNHLVDYLEKEHGALRSHGHESDDLVFSISSLIEHQGIICAIDKDLHQIPSLFYNYVKNQWKRVSKEEARYNFAVQMIIGDAGDGVNFSRGFGIKYAEKVLRMGMSDFSYLRQIALVFMKCWGKDWKTQLEKAYQLLKLHYMQLDQGQKVA